MKNLFLIVVLMVLLGSSSFAVGKKDHATNEAGIRDTVTVEAKTPFVPNAIIYTPTTEIYDDAVDIVQFEGYTLYDANNNVILKVDTSIDKPVRLKLEAGDYIVKLDGQKSPVYSISVLDNQFNEFVIE